MPQNQPFRIGEIQSFRIGFLLDERLSAERERWPLWIPVFLGAGIALYFALSTEPPGWIGPWGLAAAAIGAWLVRRRSGVALSLVCLCLILAGLSVAQMRTRWVAAPVLDRMTGAVMVEGRVSLVEAIAEGGGSRATIESPTIEKEQDIESEAESVDRELIDPGLRRARLRFRANLPGVAVGDRIRVRATLLPPARPAMPGAFDFARKAYFMGIGATGMALGPAQVLDHDQDAGPRVWLNGLRQSIQRRIGDALPGPDGQVATAIVTGETSGIAADVLAAYRNSGLAHILVIAGLHMGLLAGFVFFVVRGGLALIPAVALRYPIKKWASASALAVIGFYMALAGFPVPATRSFIMAAVVLLAVMIDRGALSLRLWAFAATVILILEPEQITGPSFQMSFSAVAVLIVAYDALGPWLAALRGRMRGWWGHAVMHMTRLALTSFMAGTATLVYGLYHFERIAPWQVAANLIAVPVVGVMVMPFALLALLAMPLGLESWPLAVMGAGIHIVTDIGFWGANLPFAQIPMPPMPVWGLIVFSLGGLWLVLWKGAWRLWGLGPMAVGLASLLFIAKPDLLIDEKATGWGVRTAEDSLLISRGGRIQRDTWAARAGPQAVAFWPKHGRSADGRLSCDERWCLYRTPVARVALVRDEAVLAEVCADADTLVVSAAPVRDTCRGARTVIDRFDTWRRGAHAVWLGEGGAVRVETVAAWQGDRPWSFHPHPRHVAWARDRGKDIGGEADE